MKIGDLVKVKTFSGEIVQRKVVEVIENTVYICTQAEWDKARSEQREPECAGFDRQFVVRTSGL